MNVVLLLSIIIAGLFPTFAVAATTGIDYPAANTSITLPAEFRGTATAEDGVAQVLIGVRDTASGNWWNGNSWATWQLIPASLDTADATTTTWRYTFDPDTAGGSGDYRLFTRARDSNGVLQTVSTQLNFHADASSGLPLAAVITSPGPAEVVNSPVTISGTATSPAGVETMLVGIRDTDTGSWWHGNNWGNWRLIRVPVTPTGSQEVTWNYHFDPGNNQAPGNYRLYIRARDVNGIRSNSVQYVFHTQLDNPQNQPPSITLNGSDVISLNIGDPYVEQGASASDPEDGDLTVDIQIDAGAVNIQQAGSYSITYDVSDSNGLSAETITRRVTVTDTTTMSQADAFRFLQRSSFGPTTEDIQSLLSQGYENWLDGEFNTPASSYLGQLNFLLDQFGYALINNNDFGGQRRYLRSDVWWNLAVNSPDQLRQRVAFALSQIFVISEQDSVIRTRVRGFANYHDILAQHAFGNFRDLLEDVTLNPMMGIYLSMRRNEKADPTNFIEPDENFAREIMQLFTIGLDELNLDGSIKLGPDNQPIPTYSQQDVMSFARVFTGWNYGDAPRPRYNARTLQSEIIPMKVFPELHDTGSKTLLNGTVLPASQTAEDDLAMALDNLFEHPNVGPFIGRQLIQHLVTSNPTPAYIERVARVFNDNGNGVRGDMKAVVRAILLDDEALRGHLDSPDTFGKLKEPLLKITQLWRAFDAVGVNGRLRYYSSLGELGQQSYSSPSVFNFYLPEYSHPGVITSRGLNSPEFMILNESTSLATANRLRGYVYRQYGSSIDTVNNRVELDLSAAKQLAANPTGLVDFYIDRLLGGDMTDATRTTIIDFIQTTGHDDDGTKRASEALNMILISPDYAIQH